MIIQSSTKNITEFIVVIKIIFEESTHRIIDSAHIKTIYKLSIFIISKIQSSREFMLGIVYNRIENQIRIIALLLDVVLIEPKIGLLIVAAESILKTDTLKRHIFKNIA